MIFGTFLRDGFIRLHKAWYGWYLSKITDACNIILSAKAIELLRFNIHLIHLIHLIPQKTIPLLGDFGGYILVSLEQYDV